LSTSRKQQQRCGRAALQPACGSGKAGSARRAAVRASDAVRGQQGCARPSHGGASHHMAAPHIAWRHLTSHGGASHRGIGLRFPPPKAALAHGPASACRSVRAACLHRKGKPLAIPAPSPCSLSLLPLPAPSPFPCPSLPSSCASARACRLCCGGHSAAAPKCKGMAIRMPLYVSLPQIKIHRRPGLAVKKAARLASRLNKEPKEPSQASPSSKRPSQASPSSKRPSQASPSSKEPRQASGPRPGLPQARPQARKFGAQSSVAVTAEHETCCCTLACAAARRRAPHHSRVRRATQACAAPLTHAPHHSRVRRAVYASGLRCGPATSCEPCNWMVPSHRTRARRGVDLMRMRAVCRGAADWSFPTDSCGVCVLVRLARIAGIVSKHAVASFCRFWLAAVDASLL